MGLELISRWFKLNKLYLNIKKTNFILFGNKHSKTNAMPTITIYGTKIDQVSKTNLFGVIINQHLTWNDHILAIKQKLACVCICMCVYICVYDMLIYNYLSKISVIIIM